jgi:uncharacterized protein (TIGR02271 family)
MITTDQVQELLGNGGTVVGEGGTKIGNIGQVFLDDETGTPEWVTVKTGMFGGAESFVLLAQGNVSGNEIQVPYGKDKVKDAPRVDADGDGHLSPDEESDLYRYYGLDYSQSDSDHGAPAGQQDTGDRHQDTGDRHQDTGDRTDLAGEPGVVGRDTSGPTTDDAMTRSEEQLNVGTQKRESGKARLRKFVVTENVTTTVPVSHEEVRVEREPITEANRGEAMSGGAITEEEHEVTLHEERPVVQKETVPVERVKMGTETVTGEETVTDEVRKEQIEADDVDVRGEKSDTKGTTGR